MKLEVDTPLQRQVAALAEALETTRAELDEARRELRDLQKRRGRSVSTTRALYVGLLLAALFALYVESSQSTAAQKSPAPVADAKFRAPFSVVDGAGNTIISVLDGPSRLFVRGPGGQGGQVAISAGASGPRVALFGSVQIPGPSPKVDVDLTSLIDTSGFHYKGKAGADADIAAITEDGGTGLIAVYNRDRNAVAFLKEKDNHGGVVNANDPSGDGVFSAGFTGDGGNACIANKKRGLQCLGINLPLQMR